MKPGREIYRDVLAEIAQDNKSIICLEADLGGHPHLFQERHPSRFFNVGIAEHNLIGIAAGLAANQFIPFASTFAPFATLRAAEMLKLSMAYMQLNIKLVCPYSGVSGAWFGPTHHGLEDLGVIQSIPGIYISAPHGQQETADAVKWAADVVGPVYIRLGRNGVFRDLDYLDLLCYPFPRRVLHWNENAEILLVSVGEMGTELSQQIMQQTKSFNGVTFSHLHLPFLDKNALIAAQKIIEPFSKSIVIEESRFLTSVASSLSLLNANKMVYAFTPDDSWPSYGGSHEEVLERMNFSLSFFRVFLGQILNRRK